MHLLFALSQQNTHKEAFQGLVQLKPYKLLLHFGHPLKKMKALSQNLFSDPVNPSFTSPGKSFPSDCHNPRALYPQAGNKLINHEVN